MSSPPRIDVLTRCHRCPFRLACGARGLDPQEHHELQQLVPARTLWRRGQVLFRAGDPLRCLHIPQAGCVRTSTLSRDGHEQVMGFCLAGEPVGLDGIAEGQHRYTAVALDTLTTCDIPLQQLEELACRFPPLQRRLLRVLGCELWHADDHLDAVRRSAPEERVILLLLNLAQRLHERGQAHDRLQLPMTRTDMASYLALAPETLSRVLRRLQDRGWLRVRGRQIDLVDLRALRRRIGPDGHSGEAGGSAAAP